MANQPASIRKRRTHTKSRKGCGNCKLRQVKVRPGRGALGADGNRATGISDHQPYPQCDEQKPTCQRCRQYGVLCNYGQKAAHVEGTLQISMNGSYHMGILPSPSAKTAVLGVVNATLRQEPYSQLYFQNPAFQLADRDLDTLARFQFRTSLSLATTGSQHLYQEQSIRFACSVSHSWTSFEA
jgi:hypothetical protein